MKYKVGLALSLITTSVLMGETFELGKIEVSESKQLDFTSTTTVVDSKIMQDKEQNTIVDALNGISGVAIQNNGARNEQMIMLRGFDVKHAPLFIDGIPIAVPYDGYVDFSRFTTYDLSQIEVSKGLTSVLLGPNTFAGAINMVTKKPTKEFEGEMGVGVFSGNGKDGYITAGTNQGNYYGIVSLSGTERDNYPLSDDFPTNIASEDGHARNNSSAQDTKINIKVGYTPNNTDEYSFNYIKQDAEKDVPPFAGLAGTGQVRYWKWRYWDKESYYFLSKTDFDAWYIKTRLYYDVFQNSLATYTNATYSTLQSGSANPSFYDDFTKGVSSEVGFRLSSDDLLKMAVHYKSDNHLEGGTNTTTGLAATEYKMQDEIYSLGVEYKHAFTNATTLTVGASYDAEKAQRADNGSYGSSSGTFRSGSSTGPIITSYTTYQGFELGESTTFNPMIKLDTKLDDTTTLYGGVSKKSRIPSIKDRYSYRLGMFVPNPDLEEESIVNYEVGGSKSFDNVVLRASLFYAKIEDYIQSAYVPIWYNTTRQQQLQNIGEVEEKGFELDASVILNDSWSVEGSYTRLDMHNESDSTVKITDVPKHKVLVSANYDFNKNFSWITTYEYDSERFTAYASSGTTTYYSSDSASIWGTKLIYRPTKALAFEAGVKNIFDDNYYINYGYPEAGRVFYSNVKYKF